MGSWLGFNVVCKDWIFRGPKCAVVFVFLNRGTVLVAFYCYSVLIDSLALFIPMYGDCNEVCNGIRIRSIGLTCVDRGQKEFEARWKVSVGHFILIRIVGLEMWLEECQYNVQKLKSYYVYR